MIAFAQPLWLLAGLAGVIGLAVFFRILAKGRVEALERFAGRQLVGRLTGNISPGRRGLKDLLILLAVFLAFAALARPQYGEQWVDVKRKGIDLLFALDTSKSMLAEDMKPNRLKRAHLAILDFVRRLDGDRVGLLPFAGTAYLMCPLTLDYDAFEQSLAAVNTELLPHGGTNIAGVIAKAMEVLDNAANHKILIIVTDGENLEGDTMGAAVEAAKGGMTIHTVGVGTARGELIPLAEGGFVKDQEGTFVTSRLDEKTLAAIAEQTGGLYAPLGTGEGLEAIYREKLALIPREELAERRHKVPIERFEWPLALSALLLITELLVGERKTNRPFPLGEFFRRRISRKSQALLLLFLLLPPAARSYGSEGEEAFRRGDYLAASEYYTGLLEKSPNDPRLQYNYGTAAFKNHLYDDAIEAFDKALRTDDVALQQRAYFNRGNSQYQKGAEMRQADPQAAAEQWRQALASLQSVLELDPNDQDARHNKEIVEKQLARLEEELQQQKQQAKEEKNRQEKERGKPDRPEQQQSEPNPAAQDETASQSEQKNDMADRQEEGGHRESEHGENPEDGDGEHRKKAAQEEPVGDPPALAESGRHRGNPEEPDSGETATPAQAARDAERRQQGKMTREEAVRMLNALKQEEGELNFVPTGRTTVRKTDKDW